MRLAGLVIVAAFAADLDRVPVDLTLPLKPCMESSIFDALTCSHCHQAAPEDDFLLCDGCVRGFHASCLGQDIPASRFWFCPACAGTTIKGCLIKALEPAGLNGLTAAQLNAQVLHLRTLDHAEPLPPEVVAMYNRTTVGERSRLCSGDKGRLEDGRPLVEKFLPDSAGVVRYRLAPEDPLLTQPAAMTVAPELPSGTIDLLSDSENVEADSAGADSQAAKSESANGEADSGEAGAESEYAEDESADAAADSALAAADLQGAEADFECAEADSEHAPAHESSLRAPADRARDAVTDAVAAALPAATAALQSVMPAQTLLGLLSVSPTSSPVPQSKVSAIPIRPAASPAAAAAANPQALSLATCLAAAFPAGTLPLLVSKHPAEPRTHQEERHSPAVHLSGGATSSRGASLGLHSTMAVSPSVRSPPLAQPRASRCLRQRPARNLRLRMDDDGGKHQGLCTNLHDTSAVGHSLDHAATSGTPDACASGRQGGEDTSFVVPDSLQDGSQSQPKHQEWHNGMRHNVQSSVGVNNGTVTYRPDVESGGTRHADTNSSMEHAHLRLGPSINGEPMLCEDGVGRLPEDGAVPRWQSVSPVAETTEACIEVESGTGRRMTVGEQHTCLLGAVGQHRAGPHSAMSGRGSGRPETARAKSGMAAADRAGSGRAQAGREAAGQAESGRAESGRAELGRAVSPDRAEAGRVKAEGTVPGRAASAHLPQLSSAAHKRKRAEEEERVAPCGRRQRVDDLHWSQKCYNLTWSLYFGASIVWLACDLLSN